MPAPMLRVRLRFLLAKRIPCRSRSGTSVRALPGRLSAGCRRGTGNVTAGVADETAEVPNDEPAERPQDQRGDTGDDEGQE